MILLCGIPSEAPIQLVAESAEALGVPFVVFHQRQTRYSDIRLDVTAGKATGLLRVGEQDWRLEDFSGVYVRLMDHHDLPEAKPRGRRLPDPDDLEKLEVLHRALLDWIEIADSRVMNRCSDMSSNVSKPYQAQFIVEAGFRTPPTLITNQPERVRQFLSVHKRVVYKSISSVRSIVKELTPAGLKDLEKVRTLPTQFQAFVPGVNIRVHVAGDEWFATEMRSEAVDYRYAARDKLDVEMVPVELPPDIAGRCVELSRSLRLPLCGIDLKKTPEGEYFCFEVNPSPGYSYFQEGSGQMISQGIVRWLRGG